MALLHLRTYLLQHMMAIGGLLLTRCKGRHRQYPYSKNPLCILLVSRDAQDGEPFDPYEGHIELGALWR